MRIRADFLLCTLLTLQPYNFLYKRFNIFQDLKFTRTNKEFIIKNKKNNLFEIKDSLLDCSLPTCSRRIFVRNEKNLKLLSFNQKTFNLVEKRKLKTYLKKFKYNYYNYFFSSKDETVNVPKPKTLNRIALEYLTIFLGF